MLKKIFIILFLLFSLIFMFNTMTVEVSGATTDSFIGYSVDDSDQEFDRRYLSELTNTILKIKLFNLFTIKKVNVRLLVDTDVYVGGETVGFNLFSEGVICVGSNPVLTSSGIQEPIKSSNLKDGDAIIKIENII